MSGKIGQLKLSKDGKRRNTDMLDTKNIFRLIESIPNPKEKKEIEMKS